MEVRTDLYTLSRAKGRKCFQRCPRSVEENGVTGPGQESPGAEEQDKGI